GECEPGIECVEDTAARSRWRFTGLPVELHPSESEGFHLNLTAGHPKVFVMWRSADDGRIPACYPYLVTLSYNEAGRLLDGGGEVEAVPMAGPIRELLEQY